MKKVILTSAAMLIAAGSFVTVQAAEVEPGVKFSGDARVRAILRDNWDFGAKDRDSFSWLDSRIRLKLKATAAGGAYAVGRVRLMDGRLQGNEADSAGTTANGDANVWADMAYIGIPFSDNFTLEGGKYRTGYGNGFFYDDIQVAGLRGIVKAGGIEVNPFIEWHSEGQNSGIKLDSFEDNDAIRYGVHVGGQVNDNWKAGFMVAYQTDDRTKLLQHTYDEVDAQGYYRQATELVEFDQHEGVLASVYFKGKEGAFGLAGEFAFNDGSLNGFNQDGDDRHDKGNCAWGSEDSDDGYGAYLQPSYTMDALTMALNFGFTKDGFMPDPGFGFFMAGGDHALTVIKVGTGGDWMWAGLVASYAISDDLSLTGIVAYADVDAPEGASDFSAWEVSAKLAYTISKGATFSWFAGMLTPDFDAADAADDPAFGTYGMLVVSF